MSDKSEKNSLTISVPEAGRRYFDIGRTASYKAAARGEIPTIQIGSRLRCPICLLDKMLATADQKSKSMAA